MDNEISIKIRKLLALGQSSNENEAAAAMAAAQALMDKYRISVAEVEAATGEKKESIVKDDDPILAGGRIVTWKKTLLSAIVRNNGCHHWFNHTHRDTKYYICGRESDIQAAKYMFAYALSELARLNQIHCRGKGHVYSDSWYNGAVRGIAEKLNSQRQIDKIAAPTCSAIVLVSNRADEAKSFLYKTIPGLKTVSYSWNGRGNSDAYNRGRAAGENINLSNKGLNSSPVRRLV